MKLSWATAALAVCASIAWGCGGSGYGSSNSSMPTAPSTPTPSAAVSVSIVGSSGPQAYSPNPVVAASGKTVMFVNNSSATHRIVQDGGGFDTGSISQGGSSAAITVPSSGTVTFHCTIHPSMTGSINGSASSGDPGSPSTGYSVGR